MSKQSGLSKACEKVRQEIAVLQTVLERMEAEQGERTKRAAKKATPRAEQV